MRIEQSLLDLLWITIMITFRKSLEATLVTSICASCLFNIFSDLFLCKTNLWHIQLSSENYVYYHLIATNISTRTHTVSYLSFSSQSATFAVNVALIWFFWPRPISTSSLVRPSEICPCHSKNCSLTHDIHVLLLKSSKEIC